MPEVHFTFGPLMVHLLLAFVVPTSSQQRGTAMVEQPPPVNIAHCTKAAGCKYEATNATMDANWRWVHGQTCSGTGSQRQCSTAGNCYTAGQWDPVQCPNPEACAQQCALEGVTTEDYKNTYGVTAIPGGLELKFVSTGGGGGMNVGSRLYLMDTAETYKLFKLKNREFTFDVDVATLRCGMNGAVYFSEMEASGGLSASNQAGAKYGTGYCDAQCPADVKFMGGKANILDWNETVAMGRYGQCCVEMDIWEANREDTAMTPHPCSTVGPLICEGLECGGKPDEQAKRYEGVCDKDGCDFNAYRLGETSFFGHGPGFAVNTEEPITVVTQWLTADGTDEGELVEIRRLYIQGGRIIENSKAKDTLDLSGYDSITEGFCRKQKTLFDDPNDFQAKGGLHSMGEALDRGMVLVLSLWDDQLTHMNWLDSRQGKGRGALRGPCSEDAGAPSDVRSKYPDASVKYTNFMYGEIGSTYNDVAQKPSVAAPIVSPAPAPAFQALPPATAQPLPVTQSPPQAPAAEPVQPVPSPPPPPLRPTPAAQRQQVHSGGACSEPYGQCGGQQWSGPTCCSDGVPCVQHDAYYSQCTPGPEFQPGMAGAIMKKDLEGEQILRDGASDDAAGTTHPAQQSAMDIAFVVAGPGVLAAVVLGAATWLWNSLWPTLLGLYIQFRGLRVEHASQQLPQAARQRIDEDAALIL